MSPRSLSPVESHHHDMEICRVCRSGASDRHPLFHPCKCSGSIKYVHQDCLEQWLKYSNKTHCELCHYKFTITPLYAEDMPSVLPFHIVVWHSIRFVLRALSMALRIMIAAGIWFVGIPYLTALVWRFNFGPRLWHRNNGAASNSINGTALDVSTIPSMTEHASDNHTDSMEENWFGFDVILSGIIGVVENTDWELMALDWGEGCVIALILIVIFMTFALSQDFLVTHAERFNAGNVISDEELNRLLVEVDQLIANENARVTSTSNTRDMLSSSAENESNQQTSTGIILDDVLEEQKAVADDLPAETLPDGPSVQVPPLVPVPQGQRNEVPPNDRRHTPPADHDVPSNIPVNHDIPANVPVNPIVPQPPIPDNFNLDALIDGDGDDGAEEDVGVAEVLGLRGAIGNALLNAVFVIVYNALAITVLISTPYHFARNAISIVHIIALEPLYRYLGLVVGSSSETDMAGLFEIGAPPSESFLTTFWEILPTVAFGYALIMYSTAVLFAAFDGYAFNMVEIQSFRRTWQKAINVFLVILKVTGISLVELVAFPISCGILVDLCTLPMFYHNTGGCRSIELVLEEWLPGNATYVDILRNVSRAALCNTAFAPISQPLAYGILSRIAFHHYSGSTSLFLHWFVGTLFMYHFASFISTVRSFVRPGLIWFIRDSTDEDFSIIQEIMEKPVVYQLEKITISLMIYAFFIVSSLGLLSFGASYLQALGHLTSGAFVGRTPLLPLRLSFDHSMEFPVDLLVIHFLLPLVLKHLQADTLYRKYWNWLFRALAEKLRLKSFYFGGRWASDECNVRMHPSATMELNENDEVPPLDDDVGYLCRVLAQDNTTKDETLKLILGIDQPQILDPKIRRNRQELAVIFKAKAFSVEEGRVHVQGLVKLKRRKASSQLLALNALRSWKDPFLVPVQCSAYLAENGTVVIDTYGGVTDSIDYSALKKLKESDGAIPPVPRTSVHLSLDVQYDQSFSQYGLTLRDVVRAARGTDVHTMIVFRPPHLKYRIIAFVVLLMAAASASHGLLLFGPICLGRLISYESASDGHALLLGFFVLAVVAIMINWAHAVVCRLVIAEYNARVLVREILRQQLRLIFRWSACTNEYHVPWDVCRVRFCEHAKKIGLARFTSAHHEAVLQRYTDCINSELHKNNMEIQPFDYESIIQRLEFNIGSAWWIPSYGSSHRILLSTIMMCIQKLPQLVRLSAQAIYVGVWIGCICPLLIGVLLELCAVVPGRAALIMLASRYNLAKSKVGTEAASPMFVIEGFPVLSLLNDWAAGALLVWLCWRVLTVLELQLIPRNQDGLSPLQRYLQQLSVYVDDFFCGRFPLVFNISRMHSALLPLASLLLFLIWLPYETLAIMIDLDGSERTLIIISVLLLPWTIFVGYLLSLVYFLRKDVMSVFNGIRDEQYRVGSVLHNFTQ